MPFLCDAIAFTDNDARLAHSFSLGGAVFDDKLGIFSGWIRFDKNPVLGDIFYTTFADFNVTHIAGGAMRISGRNISNVTILNIATAATFGQSTIWRHILASWNLSTGSAHMYVNDVSSLAGGSTLTNQNIDYTNTSWIAGFPGAGGFGGAANCALAEFYFCPNEYLDFSVASNRRKFIDADGYPVDLGVDGSTPTGTAPAVYFHLGDGEQDTVHNGATFFGARPWGINRARSGSLTNDFQNDGSGGGSGGIHATASTSPSDRPLPGPFWTQFIGTEEV